MVYHSVTVLSHPFHVRFVSQPFNTLSHPIHTFSHCVTPVCFHTPVTGPVRVILCQVNDLCPGLKVTVGVRVSSPAPDTALDGSIWMLTASAEFVDSSGVLDISGSIWLSSMWESSRSGWLRWCRCL